MRTSKRARETLAGPALKPPAKRKARVGVRSSPPRHAGPTAGIGSLEDAILELIFANLDTVCRLRATAVCKSWRGLINSNSASFRELCWLGSESQLSLLLQNPRLLPLERLEVDCLLSVPTLELLNRFSNLRELDIGIDIGCSVPASSNRVRARIDHRAMAAQEAASALLRVLPRLSSLALRMPASGKEEEPLAARVYDLVTADSRAVASIACLSVGPGFSDEHVRRVSAHGKLRELRVSESQRITGAALQTLFAAPGLEALALYACPRLRGGWTPLLPAGLRSLWLDAKTAMMSGWEDAAAHMPLLESLHVGMHDTAGEGESAQLRVSKIGVPCGPTGALKLNGTNAVRAVARNCRRLRAALLPGLHCRDEVLIELLLANEGLETLCAPVCAMGRELCFALGAHPALRHLTVAFSPSHRLNAPDLLPALARAPRLRTLALSWFDSIALPAAAPPGAFPALRRLAIAEGAVSPADVAELLALAPRLRALALPRPSLAALDPDALPARLALAPAAPVCSACLAAAHARSAVDVPAYRPCPPYSP